MLDKRIQLLQATDPRTIATRPSIRFENFCQLFNIDTKEELFSIMWTSNLQQRIRCDERFLRLCGYTGTFYKISSHFHRLIHKHLDVSYSTTRDPQNMRRKLMIINYADLEKILTIVRTKNAIKIREIITLVNLLHRRWMEYQLHVEITKNLTTIDTNGMNDKTISPVDSRDATPLSTVRNHTLNESTHWKVSEWLRINEPYLSHIENLTLEGTTTERREERKSIENQSIDRSNNCITKIITLNKPIKIGFCIFESNEEATEALWKSKNYTTFSSSNHSNLLCAWYLLLHHSEDFDNYFVHVKTAWPSLKLLRITEVERFRNINIATLLRQRLVDNIESSFFYIDGCHNFYCLMKHEEHSVKNPNCAYDARRRKQDLQNFSMWCTSLAIQNFTHLVHILSVVTNQESG